MSRSSFAGLCVTLGHVRVLFLVALTLIGSVSTASAQTSWWRTYGGPNTADWGFSVQQTTEGGYIAVGDGNNHVYLVKTDARGDTLWTRTYGGIDLAGGRSVQQTADGGYIIAGHTYAFGAYSDVYLIKTDAQGDALWTRYFGGPESDLGNSVQQTTDGGYIISGWTCSLGVGTPIYANIYLIKTDAAGDSAWTRTYGGASEDAGYSVQQTADGGYIIAGFTYSFGAGSGDVYLVKTNAQGDTLWTRTYGGAACEEGYAVRKTADGGYIITGRTSGDLYVIRTNALGDTLWTRTLCGADLYDGNSVQQTDDGGYIIAGEANWDVYLVKTDSEGDTLWTRTYGGSRADRGYSVQQTTDGGYVIAGFTQSYGDEAADLYLVKTDSLGDVLAVEEGPKPQAKGGELAATVVRRLPQDATAFDAMGRRVTHPKPGVYFVREEPQASSPKPQAVRKVLLVRQAAGRAPIPPADLTPPPAIPRIQP